MAEVAQIFLHRKAESHAARDDEHLQPALADEQHGHEGEEEQQLAQLLAHADSGEEEKAVLKKQPGVFQPPRLGLIHIEKQHRQRARRAERDGDEWRPDDKAEQPARLAHLPCEQQPHGTGDTREDERRALREVFLLHREERRPHGGPVVLAHRDLE